MRNIFTPHDTDFFAPDVAKGASAMTTLSQNFPLLSEYADRLDSCSFIWCSGTRFVKFISRDFFHRNYFSGNHSGRYLECVSILLKFVAYFPIRKQYFLYSISLYLSIFFVLVFGLLCILKRGTHF